MDSVQLLSLLALIRSPDNAARSAAEKNYTEALKSEPGRVLGSLAAIMVPASGSEEVARTQAVTLLRRAVVQVGPEASAWGKLESDHQAHLKQTLFQCLEAEPSSSVRRIIVAAIAAVAAHSGPEAPWPELVSNSFALARSGSLQHQEAALRLLAELLSTPCGQDLKDYRQDLGALIQTGLGTLQLQPAALGLVAEMVSSLDAASCQALQPVLPLVEQALKTLATTDQSSLEDALQSFISSAAEKAIFFKSRYREWMELMLHLSAARGVVEDGKRSLAFEFVATIAEHKPKPLLKAVPELPRLALEMAFVFLAEAEEDEGWENVDEDEEEDDDDGLHKAGEAKVDFFVRRLGIAATQQPLMVLVQKYAASSRWEDKLAAAMAMRAAVEYVEEATTLDSMAAVMVQLAQDQHMRVRYAALLALGQTCHDQDAEFHSRWHSRLIPLFCASEPVARCAAMRVGALEAVIGDLDEAVLEEYATPILEVFVKLLSTSSHKNTLVAVMEALGALAAGLEGSFDRHYEQLMAMLLRVVAKTETDASTVKLRGKAFECISLLGYSVGKEKFAPAASQTMSCLLATPAIIDLQTECVRDAMERMCKVLGRDFAVFLPSLLPGILSVINLNAAISDSTEDADDADDELTIPTESGFMKVKTEQIQEILAVVGLLVVLIKETGPAYQPYVVNTAEALNKVLCCADPVLNFASAVRDAVYPCWAELVLTVSSWSGKEALVAELVQRFVDKVGADLTKAEEPSDISNMANGIASVVRNASAGCLQPQQVQTICDLAVAELMKSFQREKALRECDAWADKQGTGVVGASVDDEDDDDGSTVGEFMGGEEEEEEQDCRLGLNAMFGACMKANPDVFVSHAWPTLQAMLQEWFGPSGGSKRLIGLHLACDLCEYLEERAVPIWPFFMDAVLVSVGSEEPKERNISAKAIQLAAQVPAFGAQCGPRAFAALGTALQQFKAKKSDHVGLEAVDNVVAALVLLCLMHPSTCPDLDACWQAVLAKMPLKADIEKSKALHKRMFVEATKPNGGNLGNMARVVQIFGYLCEIAGRSEHCEEDLQQQLVSALAGMPHDTRDGLLAQLSSKQRKKAERMLQEASAS